MVRSLILSALLWSTSAHAALVKFSSWETACQAAEEAVAEGDIIFLDIPDFLFRRVAASTKSWTSHVGVVFRDNQGHWIVSESKIPLSKDTPLCKFLQTSSAYRFEIKRLQRGLGATEIATMRATAKTLLGKFYHLGFDFDSSWMFCSKLVYLTYRSIDVEVGKLQTFRQLLEENPSDPYTFWKFWFFGFIPWERRTVTPASQLNDPQFKTVLDAS